MQKIGEMLPPPAVMRPPPPPRPPEDQSEKQQEQNAVAAPPEMPPPPAVMRPPPPSRPPEDQSEKQQEQDAVAAVPAPARASQRPYDIPDWSHAPGKPYMIEVLKDGSIVQELEVSEKGAFMFGRHESCDFVLEHQSISRFHAVLQYNSNGEAFLFDLASTHGTFINKLKVKPKVHVPIHVGNIIKFGLSSRMYVFQGPQELMPQEGLSRKGRQILRQLEARQEREDEEASILRARVEAASAQGATWGMGEDAVEEEIEEDDLTWQTYKGQLNEKQQKTMDQIQKRNDKLTNLKKEIDAIQAKEAAQGGLTQGQQTQIGRNEKRIEELLEQLENLEETLNDSIRESVRGKPSTRRKNKNMEDEDDDISDDDFYDRTKKKQKKDGQEAESATSLLERSERLASEIEDVKLKLAAEEEKVQTVDRGDTAADPLDAFMSSVSTEIVEDGAARLRKELERLQAETNTVAKLLKIADPSGEATRKWKDKAQSSGVTEEEVALPNAETSVQEPSTAEGTIWIGAPRPEEPMEEPSFVPVEDDAATEQFIHYKDRKEGLQTKKVVEDEPPEGEKFEANVADDIALLLRHKKGLTSSPEAEKPAAPAPKRQEKKRKKKRTLGPERPDFMTEEEVEFEAWVPPTGQTGDGRTALNEKYGY